MKENIPPFYIGQKVICVIPNGKLYETYLIKDKIYTILDINKTPCCNQWSVDVGLRTSHTHVMCGCGVRRYTDYKVGAFRFKPLQEMKAPLIMFEKIHEKEKEEILIMN